MSDLENLKAWCHWKRLEKGASEDDVAFAKAISEVIEENARLREALVSVLPMAKAWAHEHDVGENWGKCEQASAALSGSEGVKP